MAKTFTNGGDPNQTLRSAASDLGLHWLSITLLRVSRIQWVSHRCFNTGQMESRYFRHNRLQLECPHAAARVAYTIVMDIDFIIVLTCTTTSHLKVSFIIYSNY